MNDYEQRMAQYTHEMAGCGWEGGLICPDCGYETDNGHCVVCRPRNEQERYVKGVIEASGKHEGPAATWWLLPMKPRDRGRLAAIMAKLSPPVQVSA